MPKRRRNNLKTWWRKASAPLQLFLWVALPVLALVLVVVIVQNFNLYLGASVAGSTVPIQLKPVLFVITSQLPPAPSPPLSAAALACRGREGYIFYPGSLPGRGTCVATFAPGEEITLRIGAHYLSAPGFLKSNLALKLCTRPGYTFSGTTGTCATVPQGAWKLDGTKVMFTPQVRDPSTVQAVLIFTYSRSAPRESGPAKPRPGGAPTPAPVVLKVQGQDVTMAAVSTPTYTLSWSTRPTVSNCVASGVVGWTGVKAARGSATFTTPTIGANIHRLICKDTTTDRSVNDVISVHFDSKAPRQDPDDDEVGR